MTPIAVPLRRRRRAPDVPGRADVLALASLVLGYPDEALAGARDDLAGAARALPDSSAAVALRRFATWFAPLPIAEAQRAYVETFDLRRRSSLYLTYYLHGDTRRRGQALVLVKARYRAAGFVPAEAELVDYLPTALEFAAVAGPDQGEGLLRAHRVGLEMIRRSLADTRSPYADVLAAVCDVVGDLGDHGREEVDGLMAAGPPGELVGTDTASGLLDPYAGGPPGNVPDPGTSHAVCPAAPHPHARDPHGTQEPR